MRWRRSRGIDPPALSAHEGSMRSILVTGANKGIGLAIVESILSEHEDTFVYLGSRDRERGRAAAQALGGKRAEFADRVHVVELDVAAEASVARAKLRIVEALRGDELYGVVNNAGVGGTRANLAAVLETNVLGVRHVCASFVPLIASGGRVVNVTSAAGPSFVATCSPERQRFFLDESMTWERLDAFIRECVKIAEDAAAFAAKGLGNGDAYGLSKACANTYTLILAREQPRLRVNACTPGFILTDMTRRYAESQGKSPAELGMKTPAEGARTPLHLLFGALQGNGRYYGSDGKRSPLDRYRAPGSPEYTGE
jgi:NAD(P)-dependent dehydrogenase (short-subunit alcohol dehydrogenase family)